MSVITSSRRGRRRTIVQLAVVGVVAGILTGCGAGGQGDPDAIATSAAAPVITNDDTAALVAAAQAEGGLNFYSAVPPNAIAKLVGAFTGQYGIPVTVSRLVSVPLQTQFTAEVQAGAPVADIVQMSDAAWMHDVADKGEWFESLDPAKIPAAEKWPADYAYKDQVYLQSAGLFDIAYNTELVKDVPQKWEDVLNDEFKGKIIMVDPRANNATLSWMYIMRDLYGDDFLKKLGELEPQFTASTSTGINSVASGDAWLFVPTNHWSNTPLIAAGAPIDDTYPNPTTAAEQLMALVKNSPHPNAAALFMNFALSPAGQLAMCSELCTSVLNPDGTIPFPDDYITPPISEAIADKSALVGLIGLDPDGEPVKP